MIRRVVALIALAFVLLAGGVVGIAVAKGQVADPDFWMACLRGPPVSCDEAPVPTVTETETQTETVTTTLPGTTVTVTEPPTTTEPPPTTTEPPPTTTEPPPDPPGTVITLVNERFICTGPLENLGELPIILEQTVMSDHPSARQPRGVIAIESGCRGDGDPATDDLVIHQYGNGTTIGAAGDPIVIFPGARDLTITGFSDCGWIWPGDPNDPTDEAHQDGFDVRGGMDILVHDYRMGDWETGRATCQGAGGLWYPSAFLNSHTPKDDPALLQRVVCVRCVFVAGKPYDPEAGLGGRAGFIVQSMDSGATDSCFMGFISFRIRHDSPDPRGAIRPIDERNVKVDKDGGEDDPSDCLLP